MEWLEQKISNNYNVKMLCRDLNYVQPALLNTMQKPECNVT